MDCSGAEVAYQPWGTRGLPLAEGFMSAFNAAVWLLSQILSPNLSAASILDFSSSLPGPVAGHMLLFILRQKHCARKYEGMFYLKGWCCLCGLGMPEAVDFLPTDVLRCTRFRFEKPTLASALVWHGVAEWLVLELPGRPPNGR